MIDNLASIIWIFDYDLTLYGEDEREVLDSLDKRISLFVQNELGVSLDKASLIRKKYWKEYGTTLAGLRKEHQSDPQEFFDFIHTNDALIYPRRNSQKRDLIKSLKGHRVIFTNARKDWVEAGLLSMGIADLFEVIIDLEAVQWEGKPNIEAYKTAQELLIQEYGSQKVLSSSILYLEDSLENLIQAKKMNWTTIHVNSKGVLAKEIDYSLPNLLSLSMHLKNTFI